MTFRGRLRLFFAIIVVVPLIAIGAVLFSLTADSERGKADAGLATGLRVGLAQYAGARRSAARELRRLAADRVLAAALVRGDVPAAGGRLRALAAADRRVASAALYSGSGRRLARAGNATGFATASVTLSRAGGRRLGTLAVATTTAQELVRRARTATGLEFLAARDGRTLASTVPGVRALPRASADFSTAGRDYRSRRETVGNARGAREQLGVFRRADDLNRAIAENRVLVAAILVAFLLLALASSVFVVRALQEQIGRFLQAARSVAAGDFGTRLPTEGRDEFAQLAREFDSMSDQLEAKIEEVERKRRELEETIRRVGRAFATGLDRQGIFELTVQTALDACEADCGRALPLDLRVLSEVRAGATDGELDAALEAAERRAFEIRRRTGEDLLSSSDAAGSPPLAAAAATVTAGVHALALPLRARLGSRTHVQQVGVISIARRGAAFTEAQGELFEYLAAQAVISIENADLHETVQRQAVTDELTGLANLRELHAALDREFERRRRFDTPLGLLLLDIDDFKRVNDTYGHQQGDEVLVEVARVLRGLSRDVDETARYGGEELAVVLPQTDIDGAALLAERMREAIADLRIKRLDGNGQMTVTASFGVASAPGSAAAKEALIAAADAALYRAKHAGKNRVERASDLTAHR